MNGIAMLCEAVYRRANGQGWEVVGIQYAEFFPVFCQLLNSEMGFEQW
jgi:hypothetical protein